MNIRIIVGKDLMNQFIKAHASGKLSLDEIKAYAKSELQRVYNEILMRLENRCMVYDSNAVFYWEFIDGMIAEEDYAIFSYLMNEGYIDSCGIGYIFLKEKIKLTEQEQQAAEKVAFEDY